MTMANPEEKSAVLAVFSTSKLSTSQRARLVDVAKAQLTTLVNHRAEAPYRAILTGLTLHRIKADCAHGEWMPLYEQILKNVKFCTPKTAQTYCSQWMRAATEFLVEAKMATPEAVAIATSGNELSLETTDANERTFVSKMEKFIDGRSLDELLIDLGLRNGATKKKRKLLAAESAPAPTAAEKEQTVQDRFNEIEEALQLARKGATDKGTWMSFDKKQHDALKAIFEHAADQVAAIHLKTHGRKK